MAVEGNIAPVDVTLQCPHAEACGRCPCIPRTPQDAADAKSARLQSAVALMDLPDDETPDIAACPPSRQRTGTARSVSLVATAGGRRGQLGFGTADGAAIADVPGCLILAPAITEALDSLRTGSPDFSGLVEARCGDSGPAQLIARPAGSTDSRRLGAKRIRLAVDGIDFTLSAASPAPQAPALLESLLDDAADWLGSRGPLLALHAGSGLMALPLARRLGVRCVALDPDIAGCADMSRAAGAAGVKVEARAGPLRQEIQRLLPEAGPYRAVVVTPPATGVSLMTLEEVARACRERMVWFGTRAEIVARDLARLRIHGLRVARIIGRDPAPLSDQVAVLALLERDPAGAWTPPVLYEDEHCVVFAKPGGIPSTGKGSVDEALVTAGGGARNRWPIHRLDSGTSGALLFVKRKDAVEPLSAAFARGEVDREYLVLVNGRPRRNEGVVDTPLGDPGGGKPRPAKTLWRVERAVGPGHTLLAVRVESGRTHQIRRHLAKLGHAVTGDSRYGDDAANRRALRRAGLDAPFVHETVLGFPSPGGGDAIRVHALLPRWLGWVLSRLEPAAPA